MIDREGHVVVEFHGVRALIAHPWDHRTIERMEILRPLVMFQPSTSPSAPAAEVERVLGAVAKVARDLPDMGHAWTWLMHPRTRCAIEMSFDALGYPSALMVEAREWNTILGYPIEVVTTLPTNVGGDEVCGSPVVLRQDDGQCISVESVRWGS